jgi:hypothetical protein
MMAGSKFWKLVMRFPALLMALLVGCAPTPTPAEEVIKKTWGTGNLNYLN